MEKCGFCGSVDGHPVTACPAVIAIEYYPDGVIKRVEKRDPFTPSFTNACGEPPQDFRRRLVGKAHVPGY